jgi:type III secretory pathway component EscR
MQGIRPMKRIATALLFSASLMLPIVGHADDHDRDDRHRYYDRAHRDYHVWNENENRAYRHWLMEERRERRYRDYNRLAAERQREYWRWRHEHMDWH